MWVTVRQSFAQDVSPESRTRGACRPKAESLLLQGGRRCSPEDHSPPHHPHPADPTHTSDLRQNVPSSKKPPYTRPGHSLIHCLIHSTNDY